MNKTPVIVYQDEDLLVINKPYSLVVNDAETVKVPTVQSWAGKILNIPKIKNSDSSSSDFSNRQGIVHRLDKDTSGLLIIAKNPQAFEDLQRQFKERSISKKYLALVHGRIVKKTGSIDAPIARNPFNSHKFGIFLNGRPSLTEYRLVNFYKKPLSSNDDPDSIYSLLEINLKTGRTHQIRVHLKYLGHDLVSDEIYTGRKQKREDVKWCPRLFLHSFYLKFAQPKSKKIIELTIDLPEELKKALGYLEVCL